MQKEKKTLVLCCRQPDSTKLSAYGLILVLILLHSLFRWSWALIGSWLFSVSYWYDRAFWISQFDAFCRVRIFTRLKESRCHWSVKGSLWPHYCRKLIFKSEVHTNSQRYSSLVRWYRPSFVGSSAWLCHYHCLWTWRRCTVQAFSWHGVRWNSNIF